MLALLRPKPNPSELTSEPADVRAAAQAAFDAPAGLGTIASYATEAALPATGTWFTPGKGGAQADIVITAPEDGVPLLFVEIDNCFESAQVPAAKSDKYMRFCQRKVKGVDGKERPMWRTGWRVPDGRHGQDRHQLERAAPGRLERSGRRRQRAAAGRAWGPCCATSATCWVPLPRRPEALGSASRPSAFGFPDQASQEAVELVEDLVLLPGGDRHIRASFRGRR
nr:hypothetical protein [Streptomyces sp. SID9727]